MRLIQKFLQNNFISKEEKKNWSNQFGEQTITAAVKLITIKIKIKVKTGEIIDILARQ